jgi:hypothetical protein
MPRSFMAGVTSGAGFPSCPRRMRIASQAWAMTVQTVAAQTAAEGLGFLSKRFRFCLATPIFRQLPWRAPSGQRAGSPFFVNLASDEMALLIEMVVDLRMH